MAARGQAQQAATPVIGFLNTTSPDTYAFNAQAFREGLRTLGYVEGQNVAIEFRWASGDYRRMPALATELVNRNVAVLAATGDIVRHGPRKQRPRRSPLFSRLDPTLFSLG